MNYKFAQLIQTPGKKSKTISDVYIAQVDSHKEELAGKLFILIEINENSSNGLKIIDFLTDSIVQNFYQNEKLLLREKMPSLKVEHIFEAGLAKTNKQFIDFLKDKKIKINFNDLNITVGVIFDNELYLANTGKNNAFLIFPKNDPEDTNNNNFSIVNILKNKEETTEQKNYRLFSNVISGQIPKSASIFISNEALPEYISQKQLLSITSSLPPISAIEQIKNTINSINTYVSFASIIIKNTQFEKRAEISTIDKRASHDSITSMNRTEDTTEALLTPSGMISFKKWLKLLSFNKLLKNSSNKSRTPLLLKDRIHGKKKALFNKPRLQILKIFTNIINGLIQLIRSLSNKNLIKKIFNKISNKDALVNILQSKYKILISNKKILLAISVFFLIAFFLNINNAQKNKQTKVDTERYNNITQTIKQKQNQAEANLLYSNNTGAKKLFNDINTLLEELPKDTKEQQKQYQKFKAKFDKQLEKIRRIVRVDDAQELINFSNLNSRSQAENINYTPSTNKLYAADSSLKSVYILNLSNNVPTTITDLEHPIEQLKFPLIYNNDKENQIFYFNNDNIIAIDTHKDEFSDIAIPLKNFDSIGGADAYNSRLYIIDTKDNEIYRFSKTNQKFGAPSPWLNDQIDLSQSIGLSIDGYIYVLNKDATVLKLLNGKKTNFELEICDPPLEKPNKITVSKKLDFIYILEAKNNRLVVFDKNGKFLMQYKSDKLDQLKDFAIDEERKIIYVLNGSKIFKFNATHFK